MATVYLIHLDRPIKHSRHYIGYTALESAELRLKRHKQGDGAEFLAYANELGIEYDIARRWEFPDWKSARAFERKLKHYKNAPRYCPICNQIPLNPEICNKRF